MQTFKTVKEQAIDHLCVTSGSELDLTCNLTSSLQIEVILESEAHTFIGSQFYCEITERMLRLTCGYEGRHRQDLVEVAKASKFDGGGEE